MTSLVDNPNAKKTKFLTYASALLAVVLWGSSFPATRYVLQDYSPAALMLFRFSIASVTLCIIGAIRKIRLPKLKDFPMLILAGLSGVFFYSFFFNHGSVTVEAGISSFIIAASPVFTLILARVFLKEKLTLLSWIGVAMGLVGVAAVTLTQSSSFSFNLGILLIIGASVSSGIYTHFTRIVTKKYTALEATTYAMVSGTIGMLIFVPDLARALPQSNVTVNLFVVFLGVFPAALAYLAWGYAVAKAEKTAHVTVFSYLIPFISSLLGYIWLHETLSALAWIGGIVIIAGMVLTGITDFKRKT